MKQNFVFGSKIMNRKSKFCFWNKKINFEKQSF